MDDIVDLEIEAIDKILQKIQDDPEPEDVKRLKLIFGAKFVKLVFVDAEQDLSDSNW